MNIISALLTPLLAASRAILANMGLHPDTDRAIAGVTKAIDQLNAVAAREEAVIARHREAREVARVAILEAAKRQDRADRIARRFSALVQE